MPLIPYELMYKTFNQNPFISSGLYSDTSFHSIVIPTYTAFFEYATGKRKRTTMSNKYC